MDRFKKILVAASPGHLESLTLRTAVSLADANDAHLTVLDVVAPLPPWRKKMNVEGRIIDVEAALLQDREERLRREVENTRGSRETEVTVTAVSYTHLTLPTNRVACRSRWSPYH